MTLEERFVVRPLLRWFKRQKAQWTVVNPRYGSSATGWDLEARRKNQDLLIEAKYIDGPFLASFAGLVAAPLANRPQRFMVRKYRKLVVQSLLGHRFILQGNTPLSNSS